MTKQPAVLIVSVFFSFFFLVKDGNYWWKVRCDFRFLRWEDLVVPSFRNELKRADASLEDQTSNPTLLTIVIFINFFFPTVFWKLVSNWMHINTASLSNFFGCERKFNLMFFLTLNASSCCSCLASSNKFTFLMSKSICTFYTCATRSLCIKDGSAARSVVLFLCCSRLQNYVTTDLRSFKRLYRARMNGSDRM